ncbi:MAG TPA: hypothetical protein VM428_01390 [Microlunatus sp.]|nr:hypothetical protein [Microlunatus sp.]
MRGPTIGVLAVLMIMAAACGQVPSGTDVPAVSPTLTAPPSPVRPMPSVSPTAVTPTTVTPTTVTPTTPSCPAAVPDRLSLKGVQGRSFAFARLDDPDDVTVEGRVSGSQAWSTSKVLVVAAFLDTTADGDPARATAANRRSITAALQSSDADAVRSLRQQIPGSPGRAMTAVLRSVGDDETVAPDSYEGTMPWSVREQVRFMAALDAGEVVSPTTSAYLLETMRPIAAHRWGLGTVGATTFKGGWLRQGRVTRQLGLLDSYAVAISTDRGPVVRQTDGDSAHVRAMDDLAELLAARLAWEQNCRRR